MSPVYSRFRMDTNSPYEFEVQTKQGPVTMTSVPHSYGYNGIDKDYFFIEVQSNKADYVRSTGLELKLTYKAIDRKRKDPLWYRKFTNAQSNVIYIIKVVEREEVKYTKRGCICLDIQIIWEELIVDQEGSKEGGLAFDQGELLKSGKLSDFTIRAGNEKFPCHKSFLAARQGCHLES